MKRLFKDIPFGIISTVMWGVMNESFKLHVLITGFALGLLSLYLGRLLLGSPIKGVPKNFSLLRSLKYMIYLLIAIFQSGFQCIKLILKGKPQVHVVTVKTKLHEDWQKVVLANSITLTPGTITIDYFGDTFLILSIHNQAKEGLRDFEKQLMEK